MWIRLDGLCVFVSGILGLCGFLAMWIRLDGLCVFVSGILGLCVFVWGTKTEVGVHINALM